jgi:hypothetical protein
MRRERQALGRAIVGLSSIHHGSILAMFRFSLDGRNINRTYSDHPQDAEHLNRRMVGSAWIAIRPKGKSQCSRSLLS